MRQWTHSFAPVLWTQFTTLDGSNVSSIAGFSFRVEWEIELVVRGLRL